MTDRILLADQFEACLLVVSATKPTDTQKNLPLAVDRFVQDGVDNITVKTAIAVNSRKGRVGQHSEHVQIIIGAQDNVYVSQVRRLYLFRTG